ncbi:MAG: FAD-dependent oxidoreductase [Peptococcaceae bacterium]|nr:MAG: FAD-dependent oxidoreductase [Peptococcaceae bacterium]
MTKLSSLFTPVKIGGLELKNRIVMAPMGTGFGDPDGYVTRRMIDYYAERAKGGAGLITVEATCVDSATGKLAEFDLVLDDDRYIPKLSELAGAIKAHGARASLQLVHGGRYSRAKKLKQPVAPSPIPSAYTKITPRELTTEEVEMLIEKFGDAARRAQEAGFDAVELMGCTGYLISQFLSPLTNKRKDKFGGETAAERAAFAVAVIENIRRKTGPSFPVSFKHSVSEYLPGGTTIEDSREIAKAVEKAGASVFHAWAGWHESPVAMLPACVERGAFVHLAEAMKEVLSIPVIAVGRINDVALADRILAEKRADLVAMGRAFLADPHFPNKALDGNLKDIRMCTACCQCFDRVMMSMVKPGLTVVCSVNARLGREGETIPEASPPKKVLIVGGGPAGMEAARVAAGRGHNVTLWEEKEKLGGNLVPAAMPPFKKEIANLTSYLSHQMEKLGVKVVLNKKVTPDSIQAKKADEVIIATGAVPLVPDIPGVNGENVVTAVDVLNGKSKTGEKVVVVGGGMIGCETAELLADAGKKVTIIEMLNKIAIDVGPTTRWVTVKRVKEKAAVITSAEVVGINKSGVTIKKDGETNNIEADSIVLAAGMKPDRELIEALAGLPVQTAGDCAKAAKILEAVHGGFAAGCEI